ncbi:hypothetical protein N7499_002524 [Penicillium canescens]|uniref:uncharacterized protein n=1 Tax=Penicillium canescens TaxID=5083 RepID=UPI0026E0BDC0|nr:uncharacterized protein N7446_010126 [Penicillium canescens]KAJ6054114.1 hypothetical protein N7446_010126 [Penicillium canescens]KAJ6098150.1 hypothetical protein N7499_002524 [Penicillium canescens]
MATSTCIDTRSAYGTRYSTSTNEVTESQKTRRGHYELFLLIQDLLRSDGGIILEFPIDDWGQKGTMDISLGAGGFSSVHRKIAKGRWRNRSVMAYKRINPHFDQDGRFDDQGTLAQVVDELKLLATPGVRSHPNINQLKGISFETQEHRSDGYLFPTLMFDATSMGTLLDFVQDLVCMVDGPYWECCLDVAQGLQALHSQGFIHGDVKCENVLMFPTNKLQGRKFIAKLTDFGCSMTVDAVEPRQYTRLRGATIPYDAPEADAEIQSGHLPFTDTYSFGLLVWRVIIDGADPFNDRRYRSSTTDDGARYNYTLIREDKRNGSTLGLALNRVFDPDRALSPDTRDAFGEVLSIALSSEATERDLGRIIQILSHPQTFQKRAFGLSPPNAHLLREFTKFETARFRGHAQASRGLAEWKSIPPKADQFYHVIYKYGKLDSNFTGFGLSRLSPMSEALRDILVAIEDLYRTCGQPLPVIAPPSLLTSDDPQKDPRDVWDSMLRTIFLISKDAGAMVGRSVGFFRSFSVMKPFKQAASRSLKIGASMNAMLERAPAPRKERFGVLQGLYDFDGGVAAADMVAMMNEETISKTTSQSFEPVRLFADVSSHARSLAAGSKRGPALVEMAICYSMGFGIEQDQTRYFAILKECCEIEYKPAQQPLSQVHTAIGLPLAEYTESESAMQVSTGMGNKNDVINMTVSQINQRNSDGDLPLIAACRAGNIDVACLLIEKGADCALRNKLGETAIHWVWMFDDASLPRIVAQLTHSGADPNAVAKENLLYTDDFQFPLVHGTALLRAVSQGNKVAVRELILNGASVPDASGPMIFHKQRHRNLDAVQLACTWHDAEVLEILLDASPFYPINADTDIGLGLLYFAIQCQNTHLRMARYGSSHGSQLQKTIQLLLRRGATDTVDKDGMTVLQLAVRSDMPEILEYVTTVDMFMRNIGAQVNGKTVFDLAIATGRPAVFDAIVRASGSIYHDSVAKHTLVSTVELAPGNNYFLRRTLELGLHSITPHDRNTALEAAFQTCEWEFADLLMEHGADLNGLTNSQETSYIAFTVFGSVLYNSSQDSLAAKLDSILSLATKHHQQPEYLVIPGMRSSALHLVAGKISTLDHDEAARTYPILLNVFPEKHHLEARDSRGWTPLHMAVSVRNLVAVRALLDAGADINSLALFEGYPVGPSPKDMLFGQLFAGGSFNDFSPASRNRGDRALEQLIKLFSEGRFSQIAKRSVTLRAEQRWIVPQQHREVMDYVETYSLQPRRSPPSVPTSITTQFIGAVASGEEGEFMQGFDVSGVDKIQKRIQWNGIESVRFLRNQGVPLLRDMGILDAYLCDEPRRTG